ncbi:MAG TPA: YlxR family protein [Nocardioidaceae bacterium]|nr:YlxR family protein [Nocardioidaceae bacterium]
MPVGRRRFESMTHSFNRFVPMCDRYKTTAPTGTTEEPMRLCVMDPLDLSAVRTPRSRSADASSRTQPVRTCVGCREREARTDLVRIVSVADESAHVLVPDPDGSAPGRGAHLHPTTACFEQAMRRRSFGRALRIVAPFDASAVRDYVEAHCPPTATPNGKRSNSS